MFTIVNNPPTPPKDKNASLYASKMHRNDNFHTRMEDIEKEINFYLSANPELFRGKTLLLPCDDPTWSNFTRYFIENFKTFGLKKLISTSITSGGMINSGRVYELNDTDVPPTDINDLPWQYLLGDGDFRSEEVTQYLHEADIVITNPPFSLLREFYEWLLKAKKSFLFVAPLNAVTYGIIFKQLINRVMWLGVNVIKTFMVPTNPPTTKVITSYWLTNIPHYINIPPIETMPMRDIVRGLRKGKEFEHYENYDAIEIPELRQLPSDYTGMMGVPISFITRHNPDQFALMGIARGTNTYGLKTRNYIDKRMDVTAVIKRPDGSYKLTYVRMLIKAITPL